MVNSSIFASTHIEPVIASENTLEPRKQKKRHRSYPEVDHLFREIVEDQAISKTNFAVLRYTQPVNMTLKQYADDLYAKSCIVADVYNNATLRDTSIKGMSYSIYRSLANTVVRVHMQT